MAPYARHGVNVNVDFYSGVVYHLLGIKRDLFVPIFAVGRVPGWVVQVLEQLDNNILIRPLTLYNGPDAAPTCRCAAWPAEQSICTPSEKAFHGAVRFVASEFPVKRTRKNTLRILHCGSKAVCYRIENTSLE